MKKRFFIIFALVLALVLVGCIPVAPEEPETVIEEAPASDVEADSEAEKESGEVTSEEPVILRVGGLTDADCWNPFACTAPSPAMWGDFLYGSLKYQGPASEGCLPQPEMAESWDVSEDGLTVTIKLAEGMYFHDGTPITAKTVTEILEWRAATPGVAEWYTLTAFLDSVEVIDDYTFSYTTTYPLLSAIYGYDLGMAVLPVHIWEEVPEEEVFLFENYPTIGSGPYKLTEHVSGSHMIFEAVEDYYLGKPPVDKIVYSIYSNPDALVNALIAGEIDLTRQDLAAEHLDTLGQHDNITVVKSTPKGSFDLAFNMSETFPGHPAILDPMVREAIDYAIDKETIANVVFLGHAMVCPTGWACGPDYEGKVPTDLTVTPFDPAKANQILEDAGYADTDGDGVRETADGQPLNFRFTYQTEFSTNVTLVEMIADWLMDIGITVELIPNDWGTWYAAVLENREFDLTIDQRVYEIDPQALDFWLSCWSAEPGGFNTSGYCSEEMDGLVADFMFSSDPVGRWESAYEAQRMLNRDRPFITLVGKPDFDAFRNDRFIFSTDNCLGTFRAENVLNVTFP